jgi:hypothetical protein
MHAIYTGLTCIAIAALTACGGGGGSSSPAPATGSSSSSSSRAASSSSSSVMVSIRSHRAGEDCLGCHRVGGQAAAFGIFTVAGTANRANAVVKIYTPDTTTVQLTLDPTDGLGNFWTTASVPGLVPIMAGSPIVNGIDVAVVNGGTMSGVVSNGSCNVCHGAGNGNPGRISYYLD